jgi:NAD+ kinase
MKTPKILLIYKRSSLSVAGKLSARLRKTRRFENNHATHYATLRMIEGILKRLNIKYHKHARGKGVDYRPFDLVITIGGDGTILEAARALNSRQMILGVNSDPNWSVGQFCCCEAKNFEVMFKRFLSRKAKVCRLYKLKLRLYDGKKVKDVECLNDVLICHANPGAMSRYELSVGKTAEDQRSSGVWFSTAAGSTGAMLSAGGRAMPLSSTDIQYKPRELYHSRTVKYYLTGGLIKRECKASLVSTMAHGYIFVDGAHIKFPFTYGSRAEISSSAHFIQLVHD